MNKKPRIYEKAEKLERKMREVGVIEPDEHIEVSECGRFVDLKRKSVCTEVFEYLAREQEFFGSGGGTEDGSYYVFPMEKHQIPPELRERLNDE